tara:strand:- start:484 stop:1371 length:888 start_codon:yes stop_codon:yes gene_type:complete
MKSILIKNLVSDMKLQGFYLCIEKRSQKKKDGSPYLNLLLQDKTGIIRARIWDNVQKLSKKFDNGDPVAIKGKTYQYGSSLMIKVENISKATEKKYQKYGFNATDLIPKSKENPNELWKKLIKEVDKISKKHFKLLTKKVLNDHKQKFKIYPASISFHYNYQGGLVEQTISIIKISKAIGKHYSIDNDLLLTGACLHQIGKLYSINLGSSEFKLNKKSLLGNAILSRDIVNKYIRSTKNFPKEDKLKLEHLILSYQGRKEWQSPVEPQTIEAILLHTMNYMDSQVNVMKRSDESL